MDAIRNYSIEYPSHNIITYTITDINDINIIDICNNELTFGSSSDINLRANNDYGSSTPITYTIYTKPTAPDNLLTSYIKNVANTNTDQGQIDISFSMQDTQTNYEYDISNNINNTIYQFSNPGSCSGTGTFHTAIDVSDGYSYTITVDASNVAGHDSSFITQNTPPGVITLVSNNYNNGYSDISFNIAGNQPINNYNYSYTTSTAWTSSTTTGTTGFTTSSTSTSNIAYKQVPLTLGVGPYTININVIDPNFYIIKSINVIQNTPPTTPSPNSGNVYVNSYTSTVAVIYFIRPTSTGDTSSLNNLTYTVTYTSSGTDTDTSIGSFITTTTDLTNTYYIYSLSVSSLLAGTMYSCNIKATNLFSLTSNKSSAFNIYTTPTKPTASISTTTGQISFLPAISGNIMGYAFWVTTGAVPVIGANATYTSQTITTGVAFSTIYPGASNGTTYSIYIMSYNTYTGTTYSANAVRITSGFKYTITVTNYTLTPSVYSISEGGYINNTVSATVIRINNIDCMLIAGDNRMLVYVYNNSLYTHVGQYIPIGASNYTSNMIVYTSGFRWPVTNSSYDYIICMNTDYSTDAKLFLVYNINATNNTCTRTELCTLSILQYRNSITIYGNLLYYTTPDGVGLATISDATTSGNTPTCVNTDSGYLTNNDFNSLITTNYYPTVITCDTSGKLYIVIRDTTNTIISTTKSEIYIFNPDKSKAYIINFFALVPQSYGFANTLCWKNNILYIGTNPRNVHSSSIFRYNTSDQSITLYLSLTHSSGGLNIGGDKILNTTETFEKGTYIDVITIT